MSSYPRPSLSTPAPAASTSHGREISPTSSSKKKRPKTGTVYSQPTDTGVGRHWATQLLYAVNFLKSHGSPIRLEDLAIRSNVEALLNNAELLASFQAHERVVFDDRTELYSYKPDFVLKSPADLLSLLRRYAPRGGLTVKTLRESWPAVGPAIEQLEKEGKVLVTRTVGTGEREGQMKAVFLDDVGNAGKVDKEFQDLWSSLKTPIADELAEELRSAGLNAASSVITPITAVKKKKGKKGAGSNNRRHKITNVHLNDQGIDLSKDYAPTRK